MRPAANSGEKICPDREFSKSKVGRGATLPTLPKWWQCDTARTFDARVESLACDWCRDFHVDPLTLPPYCTFCGIGRAPPLPTLPGPRDGNTARIVKPGYHAAPDVQLPRIVEEIYCEAALCAGGVRESPLTDGAV